MPVYKPNGTSHLTEDELQTWCIDYAERVHPSLLVVHIPNGGQRHPVVAAKLKAMGTRAGVLDLLFILPNGRVHWVEMKTKGGRVSDNQKAFMGLLDNRGHTHEVCWSQDEWMALCKRMAAAI